MYSRCHNISCKDVSLESLKNRILTDGKVVDGNILQVSSFLNHMVDMNLLSNIGKEFATIFKDCRPTKILTIEASGIPIATMCAFELQIPLIIAKKNISSNLTGAVYCAEVFSHTKQKSFNIIVLKEHLNQNDRVVIIDDFLAFGAAVRGTIHIIEKAQATLVGVGICIEKSYQQGASELISQGVNLHSLVKIKSLENGIITFH